MKPPVDVMHLSFQLHQRSGFAAGGAAVGGLVGMPGAGAAAGDMLGGVVTGKMSESAALKAAQGRMVKLADFPK